MRPTENWVAFWRGESSRPLFHAIAPKPGVTPVKRPRPYDCAFGDLDPIIEQTLGWAAPHDFLGDALQQIYEAGPAFAKLIDHPAFIEHVKRFVGNQNDFDAALGPLYIDECFALTRGPGGFIGMHSGGHQRAKRTQFRHHNGQISCGQINVFIPLTDIGPGDGGTLVVPGSHKANFPFPKDAGEPEPTVEVHLERGDVLLFVDAIRHGSATRANSGLRKVVIYRFGPSWGNSRFGYLPSKALLQRLTPAQRQIVQPQTYRLPPHVTADEVLEALKLTTPGKD